MSGITTAPHTARGTFKTRKNATRMPAINAMCSPLMAKICIVPERMNGSDTSPVSAVFPAQGHRPEQAQGFVLHRRPRAKVALAQAPNRSAKGGEGVVPASVWVQSFADAAFSW